MESSALPNLIDSLSQSQTDILQIDDTVITNQKICKSAAICMSFPWKHQKNTLYHFDRYTEGNATIKKSWTSKPSSGHILKGNTLKGTTKWHTPKCHLGMPAGLKPRVSNLVFSASSHILAFRYIFLELPIKLFARSFNKNSQTYRHILLFWFYQHGIWQGIWLLAIKVFIRLLWNWNI